MGKRVMCIILYYFSGKNKAYGDTVPLMSDIPFKLWGIFFQSFKQIFTQVLYDLLNLICGL